MPTGSEARGLGEGAATVLLPIWLQKTVGPWTTYGGGGYRIRTAAADADRWFFGWQVQRRMGPVALGVELYRETESARTLAGANGFSVGAVVDMSDVHHLLLSFGTGPGPQNLHAYLGWQLTLRPQRVNGEHGKLGSYEGEIVDRHRSGSSVVMSAVLPARPRFYMEFMRPNEQSAACAFHVPGVGASTPGGPPFNLENSFPQDR